MVEHGCKAEAVPYRRERNDQQHNREHCNFAVVDGFRG